MPVCFTLWSPPTLRAFGVFPIPLPDLCPSSVFPSHLCGCPLFFNYDGWFSTARPRTANSYLFPILSPLRHNPCKGSVCAMIGPAVRAQRPGDTPPFGHASSLSPFPSFGWFATSSPYLPSPTTEFRWLIYIPEPSPVPFLTDPSPQMSPNPSLPYPGSPGSGSSSSPAVGPPFSFCPPSSSDLHHDPQSPDFRGILSFDGGVFSFFSPQPHSP